MLPGAMPAFMPALSMSGVISAGTSFLGAAPAIETDHTLPVALWNTVMKPLPPMPFISGSPSADIAPTAATASKALPPFSRICRPADEVMGCPLVTRPWRPATAGRASCVRLDAGASAACCCATTSAVLAARTSADTASRARVRIRGLPEGKRVCRV